MIASCHKTGAHAFSASATPFITWVLEGDYYPVAKDWYTSEGVVPQEYM